MKRIKILVPALVLLVSMCLLHFPSSAASSEVRWAVSGNYEFDFNMHDNMSDNNYSSSVRCELFKYYEVSNSSSSEEFSNGEFYFYLPSVPDVPSGTFVRCDIYLLLSRYSYSSSDLFFSNFWGLDNYYAKKISYSLVPSKVDFSQYSYASDPYHVTSYYDISFDFDASSGFGFYITENVLQPGVFGFCVGGISYAYSVPDLSDVVSGLDDVNNKLDDVNDKLDELNGNVVDVQNELSEIERILDEAFNAEMVDGNGDKFSDKFHENLERFDDDMDSVLQFEQNLSEYLAVADRSKSVFDLLKLRIVTYQDAFRFWATSIDFLVDDFVPLETLFYLSIAGLVISVTFRINLGNVSRWGHRVVSRERFKSFERGSDHSSERK